MSTTSASTTGSVDFNERRARFQQQYGTPEAILAYRQRLKTQWPERAQIAQHIADLILALGQPQPQVLELCCGFGRLAEVLLAAVPNLHYTGLDVSPPFLEFARQQLAAYPQVALWEVDLNDETWLRLVTPAGQARFQAIVSLQSLHDVGDESAVSRVYGLVKPLLVPGGFFLNADLIVAEGEALPNNPGRLSIARHLQLLRAHGYEDVACTLATGGFGSVIGWQRTAS